MVHERARQIRARAAFRVRPAGGRVERSGRSSGIVLREPAGVPPTTRRRRSMCCARLARVSALSFFLRTVPRPMKGPFFMRSPLRRRRKNFLSAPLLVTGERQLSAQGTTTRNAALASVQKKTPRVRKAAEPLSASFRSPTEGPVLPRRRTYRTPRGLSRNSPLFFGKILVLSEKSLHPSENVNPHRPFQEAAWTNS